MHGPGLSYYSPEFPAPERGIVVYDTVVGTLRLRRKRKWQEALARAIEMWTPAVKLVRFTGDPQTFVGLGSPTWSQGAGSEVASFSVPGRITLVRSTYTPDAPKYWPHAWNYAYASFFNVPRILKQTDPFYALDRTICHEVGHALGLAHGGNGIMSGGLTPNAHDLDAVRSYHE